MLNIAASSKSKSLYTCMHTCINMTRVISLSDEAYNRLKAAKNEGESFSVVVNRTFPLQKKSLLDLWGKWSGSKEETDRIFKEIYADRKKIKLRKVEF